MGKPIGSIAVLDAPSNLGLRPAAPGKVPGVFLLPQALRSNRIFERLCAVVVGEVWPHPFDTVSDHGFCVRT